MVRENYKYYNEEKSSCVSGNASYHRFESDTFLYIFERSKSL